MQQTKKFKMADAISPYLAVSCGLRKKDTEMWRNRCHSNSQVRTIVLVPYQYTVVVSKTCFGKEVLFRIWVRLRNCGCLVTWFCYQLIAKPGNKAATVSWPDPYISGYNLPVNCKDWEYNDMVQVCFNSLWSRDTIWPYRSRLDLAQVMACCLFCAKQLSEPMLAYC